MNNRLRKGITSAVCVALWIMSGAGSASAAEPWGTGVGASVVTIQHIDSTNTTDATVVASFYTQDSLAAPADFNYTIKYKGQARIDVATLAGLGAGWKGSLVVSGDKRLAALATDKFTGNAYGGKLPDGSADTVTSGTYGSMDPSNVIYFPYVTTAQSIRFSTLTIQNAEPTQAVIDLEYRGTSSGALEATQVITIESYRSKSIQLGDPSSVNYPSATFPPISLWNGSVKATGRNGAKIVGQFTGWWNGGWQTDYTAATTAGTTLFAVNAFRRVATPNASQPENGTYRQWSNLFLLNTGSVTSDVTITYINTGGSTPVMTVTTSIEPNKAKELNTRYGGQGGTDGAVPTPATFFSKLGDSFAGSVKVVSTNGQPMVGVVHNFWSTSFYAGSTEVLATNNDAATAWFVPAIPRSCVFGTNCTSGTGDWKAWGKVAVTNLGGSPANVTFQAVNQDGSAASSYAINNIAAGGGDALNTRYGSDGGSVNESALQSLTNSFVGGMYITSTQPVIVTVFNSAPEDIDNYNAFK